MTVRRGVLMAGVMGGVGALLGWFIIGTQFANSLQVEQPGNIAYDEYTLMRDASPWAGAAVGLCLALAVACVPYAAALLLSRRRVSRTVHGLRSSSHP